MKTRMFSNASNEKLRGVHPDLIQVVQKALQHCHTDFSVQEGLRTLDRQKQLFMRGMTKTLDSKHIVQADGYGHAVDLYPYPINMDKVNRNNAQEICRWGMIAQSIYEAAKVLGIKVRLGIDWDGDGETLDNSFFDAPHVELVV